MSVGFLTPRISALFDELSTRIDARDWVAAVPIGEELLALAGKTGGEHIEAPASQQLAIALYELHGPRRAERLERVIALLGRALEIYDRHPELADAASRALALQNLGTAYAERLIGDPVANQERAIALQRRALELISREADGRSWAMAEANLGLSLLELARQRDWEESEGEEEPAEMQQAAEEIEEGISHLERSLEWRSVERDPRDFAYTKINLGLAFNRRMRGDRRANIKTALRHYEEAADAFARSKDELQLSQVKHNTSSARLEPALMEESADRRAALLEAAIADVRGALELRSLEDAPYHAGRSWRQLGECLRASGDRAGAIDAFSAALEGLTPEIAPEQARDTARALAELATEENDWAVAAMAWTHAAEAAANALEARVTGAGRSSERRRNLNVFRFAAYAVARAGDLERAVEILEWGRARELAAWVSRDLLDLERVRALEPRLAERFVALQSELDEFERPSDSAEPGSAARVAGIAEARRQVIDEIRQLPGLASFLERPAFAELTGSLSEGEAIAYLLTSPRGSLALLVGAAAEGVGVEAIQAPDLRSTDLVSLFLGFDLEGNFAHAPGYVLAHRDRPEELDAAIDRFSPLLGERLLRRLDEALSRGGITSVCLIPISLLGLLPLHALPWNDAGRARCLIDRLVVSFAPSAVVRRVCRSRAESSGPASRAVIIGNPLPQASPLDGAELEATLVASSLTGAQTEVIVGTDATKDRVVAALPAADLAHFACHAAAAIFGGRPGEAALYLANDEPLTADEIRTLRSFRPRLVVASACESGVIEGYEEADEALSLGVMFIAAGAAGVISTLWAIDDYATMLLMTRFYELLNSKHTPARALRAAQLWLRELTPAEEDAYLANRAALRARRDEKRQRGEARGDGTAALGSTERPYAALSIWAAFIFSGA